jgi:hypothetical protein
MKNKGYIVALSSRPALETTASYLMGTWVFFPGDKVAGA